MNCDLHKMLAHLQAKIAASDESLERIARGADVGTSWLTKFAKGEIPSPGIVNLQKLNDYFSKKAA